MARRGRAGDAPVDLAELRAVPVGPGLWVWRDRRAGLCLLRVGPGRTVRRFVLGPGAPAAAAAKPREAA